jgi:D-alanyl-D-alanine carboxypeptidase (penicillin-binding protein 5/6)
MMNQTAESLGMDNTHFADPTGLPSPENLATAHDLSILASAIIDQYPQYYHFFSEKWFVWNNIRQPNRNKLLWRDLNVDGLKTGYTVEAGYCLVSSASQPGTRFVTVILGAPSPEVRANDSQALLNYAFRFFQTQKVYSAGQTIVEQRVWKGQDKYVALGVAKNFGVTLPRTALADIKITMEYSNDIVAPVAQNQVFGTINVYLKDQLIASQPIVALKDDPKGGFFTRFFSGIAHFFYGLFHKDTVMQDVVTK